MRADPDHVRLRRLSPLAAAMVGTLTLVASAEPRLASQPVIDAVTTLTPFPICFTLGLTCRRWWGLVGALLLAICFEINQGYLNPFVPAITIGPWYAATLIRDRRLAARELAALTQELELENEQLTEQAVRLERARIAHELHDIVAHCVSLMVVQAYAGARLAGSDPTAAAAAVTALDHIAAAAEQAQHEIGHLVDLLATDAPPGGGATLSAGLAELVATAAATGIQVTLQAQSDLDELPPSVGATAYRIVQESITNALKHAPGAAIDIVVASHATAADVLVTSRGGMGSLSPLHHSGGGRGIDGMRERAAELGGDLHAGPERDGWRVVARLPLHVAAHPSAP